LAAAPALLLASAARAGPPFLTDDPEPTESGHWEIYAPLFEAEGAGADYGGSLGVELNYGAAKNLQVTVGLPVAYRHDAAGGVHWGRGDLEVSAKYRFIHDEASGLQVAFFPGLSLPTGSNGLGAGRITALLPVWGQKDFGRWSVFGGGGYAIHPGPGNRDYWTGGVALTRQFGERLLIGAEVDRQGTDTVGGRSSTSLGIGAIYDLPGPSAFSHRAAPRLKTGAPAASTAS
jgi:hypothetical protein